MRIILASTSPRRRELMKQLNIPFEVITKGVDESFDSNKSVYEACMEVAKRKAQAVYDEIKEDVIVIGSDTIVVFENEIFGKPKDYNEAYLMLEKINGKTHEVVSSLCLLVRKDGNEYEEITYDKCNVTVNKMEQQEIEDWINNNDVYSKAGAYAIQEEFGKYVTSVSGDYFSIVGLPIHKLYELLKKYR